MLHCCLYLINSVDCINRIMNTRSSQNKLILKLAKKNSTTVNSNSIQGQSTWELIRHTENSMYTIL